MPRRHRVAPAGQTPSRARLSTVVPSNPGPVTLRRWTEIPADQAWFWTAEWQEGEWEASAELAAGEGTFYEDVDALLAGLNG